MCIRDRYNNASEVVSQTDELMHTTTTVYDEIGRMLNTINHLNETSNVSEYDIAGRMSAQIDPFDERLSASMTTQTAKSRLPIPKAMQPPRLIKAFAN